MAKSRKIALTLTFLITFCTAYYTFFVWDIPYNNNEEVGDLIVGTNETAWHTLILRLINPRSEHFAVMGGRELLTVRVTQPMIFKVFYDLFGDHLDKLIQIHRILLGPILALLMFWLLHRITGNILLSTLGALFLITSAPYGISIAEIRDHEPTGQVFLLGYVMGFFALFERIRSKELGNTTNFAWGVVGLWLLGMLAIRSKESLKVAVPIITWAILIFNPRAIVEIWKSGNGTRRRFAVLGLLGILVTIPLLWHKSYDSGGFSSPHHFISPLRVLFWNAMGWEPEIIFPLLNVRLGLPGSLLGTLGAPLGWLFLVALAYVLWKKTSRNEPMNYWGPLVMWLGSMLAIHLISDSLWDLRILTMSLLPFGFLVFYTFHQFIRCVNRPLVMGILVLLVGLQVLINIKHTLYIRHEYGSKVWTAHHNSRKEVYIRRTGDKDVTELDLTRFFYLSKAYPLARKDAMWPSERNLEPSNPYWSDYEKLLAEHDYFYFASYHKQPESDGVRLVKKLDCLNNSPYAWFIRRFKPERIGEYWLYEVTELPARRQ